MGGSQQNLQTSILDRLLDPDSGLSSEPVQYRLLSIGEIKASVIRDLERLLNSRRQIRVPPAEYPEVSGSLYVYGLRDFTAENPNSIMVQQQLRQDIERTISRFEPRLKQVRVHLENQGNNERKLWFRIIGVLVVEPISEPVAFDTFFDMNRSQFVVSG